MRLTPPCGLAPNFESSFRWSLMRWPFTRTGEGDCAGTTATQSSKIMERRMGFIAHQCTPAPSRGDKSSLLAIASQRLARKVIGCPTQQYEHGYRQQIADNFGMR